MPSVPPWAWRSHCGDEQVVIRTGKVMLLVLLIGKRRWVKTANDRPGICRGPICNFQLCSPPMRRSAKPAPGDEGWGLSAGKADRSDKRRVAADLSSQAVV
jgi:hypothetical protein